MKMEKWIEVKVVVEYLYHPAEPEYPDCPSVPASTEIISTLVDFDELACDLRNLEEETLIDAEEQLRKEYEDHE